MPHHPFRGLIVPVADFIHEISKSHFSLRKTILQYSYLNAIRIIALFLIIFSGQICAWAEERFLRIHFIDVGYGDAILLDQAERRVLIDAGPAVSANKLLNYLLSLGIRKIDSVIITHPHENHFGGLQLLAQKIAIGQVFMNGDQNGEAGYDALLSSFKKKEIPIKKLKKNDAVDIFLPDSEFLVLHPAGLADEVNANSIVSWLKYGQTSFLFTADIGEKIQDDLIQEFPDIKTVDCLQIPHHGGRVSDRFAQYFLDPLCIVSTGPNPWGKPNQENLQKMKCLVLRTDLQGTIIVESDGQNVKLIQPRLGDPKGRPLTK